MQNPDTSATENPAAQDTPTAQIVAHTMRAFGLVPSGIAAALGDHLDAFLAYAKTALEKDIKAGVVKPFELPQIDRDRRATEMAVRNLRAAAAILRDIEL